MTTVVNDNLVMIAGEAIQGKSASFKELINPEGVMYLNCESGKKLPFPSKFKQYIITDPLQVPAAFDAAEPVPEFHTIIVDSQTFLMNMFESLHVLTASDTMKGQHRPSCREIYN